MKAQHSSHMDTAGSKDRDSLHSTRNMGSRNSQPETQTLFLQIHQHQNVAPEQKRFPLPLAQLREVFSKSLLFTSHGLNKQGTGKFPVYSEAIFFGYAVMQRF
jgi:hypothetical protein